MRRARTACGFALAATLGCVVAPPAPLRSDERAADRVVVHYPAGECAGELELELYDRAAGTWRPHSEHPRLSPGACALEAPGRLLNELRVRCVDPSGRRAPSEWVVGAELAPSVPTCAGAVVP